MVSSGTIKWKSIKKMLKDCAPGHKIAEGDHYYRITYKDRTYRSFPKGTHGKSNPEIERGHVRKLVRFLKIKYDCAKKALPAL